MAQAQKRCPICDTPNPKKAAYCMNCGASLTHAHTEVKVDAPPRPAAQGYDFRYGETDLSEVGLNRKARLYLTGIMGVVLVLLIGAGVYWIAPRIIPQPVLTPTIDPANLPTETARPTLALASVTPAPPTDTPSPTPTLTYTPSATFTPEPCVQVVGPGEGMLALISRCGHRNLDVIPLVVTLNGLNNENDLRANQTILIPFPTPTPDPNALPAGESRDAGAQTVSLSSGELSAEDIRATQAINPFFRPTPTNPPGVGNHTIAFGETIIDIIARYNTNIDSIDKLNPQLDFYQCEMGQVFGGPSCVVPLYEGQTIRVPVPTPTPTFTFTPNGSETPTPTATATYNAPKPSSPSNRAYFRKDEFITLRWAATGLLAPDEVYLVTVQNLTDGVVHSGETRELYWIVPKDWQSPQLAQIEYIWTVAIATAGQPDTARHTTAPISFTWEGRGEPKS